MFTQENNNIYETTITDTSTVKESIGSLNQYSTTETDTQIIYQWQKFNLDLGIYEDDTTNVTSIEGITPTNGQVITSIPIQPKTELQIAQGNIATLNDSLSQFMDYVITNIPTLPQ